MTANSDNVDVTVHDLRGRLIMSKNIKASGLVNEQLQLTNASSGIYLVTVEDGARKITKKIVVE